VATAVAVRVVRQRREVDVRLDAVADPKSARPAWIPESTIAIVGVFQDEIELSPLQFCDAPDSYGQSCAEL
jgi:hypothetical protein